LSLAACGAPEFHSEWLDREPSEGVFRASSGTSWLEFNPTLPTFQRAERLLSVCGTTSWSASMEGVDLCASVRLSDSVLGKGPMTLTIVGQAVDAPDEEFHYTAGKGNASGVESALVHTVCMWGDHAQGTSTVLRGRLQLEENGDRLLAGRLVLTMEGEMGPCVSGQSQAEMNVAFSVRG